MAGVRAVGPPLRFGRIDVLRAIDFAAERGY
jgi:hypothetical protein